MTRKLYLLLIALAALARPAAQEKIVFIYSPANPSPWWELGYSASPSLAPGQFRVAAWVDTSEPVVMWHPSKPQSPERGYYPYVAFNPTGRSRTTSSNGWALRPGQFAMEAANDGAFSIVRFVAPVAAAYRVTARFEGIHYRLSTTDVHVLHNGTSLYTAEISGYGGDPAFHKVEGANPAASYTGTVQMNKGDTIAFAVGYGVNRTHYNDTTGLTVEIIRLSPGPNSPTQ
jgi:hypothetical protein